MSYISVTLVTLMWVELLVDGRRFVDKDGGVWY